MTHRTCSEPDCEFTDYYAVGLCRSHYDKRRKARGSGVTIVDIMDIEPKVDLLSLVQEPEEVVDARHLFDALGVPYTYAVTSDGYNPATDSYTLRFTVTPQQP